MMIYINGQYSELNTIMDNIQIIVFRSVLQRFGLVAPSSVQLSEQSLWGHGSSAVEQIVMQCNVLQSIAMQCNVWQCHSFQVQCCTAQFSSAMRHNFPVQCGTMWPDFLCHGCLRQFPSPRPQELTANQNVPKCAINMSKRTKKHKYLRYTQIYKLSSILNLPNLTSEYVLLLFFLHLTNSQTNKPTDNHV